MPHFECRDCGAMFSHRKKFAAHGPACASTSKVVDVLHDLPELAEALAAGLEGGAPRLADEGSYARLLNGLSWSMWRAYDLVRLEHDPKARAERVEALRVRAANDGEKFTAAEVRALLAELDENEGGAPEAAPPADPRRVGERFGVELNTLGTLRWVLSAAEALAPIVERIANFDATVEDLAAAHAFVTDKRLGPAGALGGELFRARELAKGARC